MLIGEYTSQITSGNRTALPKKFRESMGDKLILSRGYEGCLILVSLENWLTMVKDVAEGPFVSSAVRDTSRFLLGGAHEIQTDAQGRFVIPASLVTYAQIRDDLVFLGLGRWVEVWEMSNWREREKYLGEEGSKIAETLSQLRLQEEK